MTHIPVNFVFWLSGPILLLVLVAGLSAIPLTYAIAGSASSSYGVVSGGPGSGTATATVSSIGIEGVVSGIQSTATTLKGAQNANGGACGRELNCTPLLQQEYKKILLKLLSTYYALGTGNKDTAPAQAEIFANLMANVATPKH